LSPTLNVNARRRVEGRDETLEKKRNSCTSNSVRNHGNSGLLPPLLRSRASSAEADWSIRETYEVREVHGKIEQSYAEKK
jgi:hypothetical protein